MAESGDASNNGRRGVSSSSRGGAGLGGFAIAAAQFAGPLQHSMSTSNRVPSTLANSNGGSEMPSAAAVLKEGRESLSALAETALVGALFEFSMFFLPQ